MKFTGAMKRVYRRANDGANCRTASLQRGSAVLGVGAAFGVQGDQRWTWNFTGLADDWAGAGAAGVGVQVTEVTVIATLFGEK